MNIILLINFRKKSVVGPTLNISCFTLIPSSGEIYPGGTRQIEIQCYPDEPKEYNEMIFLHVTEPLKEHLHGQNINLHVTGSEPLMNFNMTKDIFKEHFFVQNIEQFHPPIFVSMLQVLLFFRLPERI